MSVAMKNAWLKVFRSLVVLGGFFSLPAAGNVVLSGRQIVLLQADTENIWGTWYFAVQNNGKEPAEFSSALALPKETVDFRAGENLKAEELALNTDGKVLIKKRFPPGLSLMGISFQVPVRFWGNDVLSLRAPADVAEWSFAVSESSGLTLHSEGFRDGVPAMLAGGEYRGIISTALPRGTELKIELLGLPKLRPQLLLIAAAFALLLFSAAAAFVVRSRKDHYARHSS